MVERPIAFRSVFTRNPKKDISLPHEYAYLHFFGVCAYVLYVLFWCPTNREHHLDEDIRPPPATLHLSLSFARAPSLSLSLRLSVALRVSPSHSLLTASPLRTGTDITC